MEFPDKYGDQPKYGETYEVEASFMGVFAVWQRFYHLKGFDQIKPDGRRICFNKSCFVDISNLQEEIDQALIAETKYKWVSKGPHPTREEFSLTPILKEPKVNLLTLKCQLKAAMLVLQNSKDKETQQKALMQIDQLIIKIQNLTADNE